MRSRSRVELKVKVKVKVKGVKFATRPTTSGYSNTASSKMKQSEDIVALGPGLQSLVDTTKEDYNRLNLDQPSDDGVTRSSKDGCSTGLKKSSLVYRSFQINNHQEKKIKSL